MDKDKAKEDIENIKSDIKSLVNNLSKLKGDSGAILSDSFDQLLKSIADIKGGGSNKLQTSSFAMKAITWIYGDAIKKAAISIGIAALATYLMKKDD